jgi:hypothetical protein
MKRTVSGVALEVLIVLSLCGPGTPPPATAQSPPDEPVISSGDDPFDVRQHQPDEHSFAVVRLPNGSELEFFEITRGGAHAFGVLERSLAMTRSAFDPLGDTDPSINPLELFNAVTEPGTRIPQRLLHAFGPPTLGPQGWLLGELSGAGMDWCNTTQFENHINAKNYASKLLRLNKGPDDSDPEWIQAFYNFQFLQWGWWATLFNIDLYYTRVAVCGLGNHPAYCDGNHCFWFHPGPVVMFRYQNANNWPKHFGGYALIEDVEPLFAIGKSWGWVFYTGPNWDWMTSITHAQEGDKFNIGLAWTNNVP